MQANSLDALRQHSHQLLQLTTQQAALSARQPLLSNDTDNLQLLVEQLKQHPYVYAATIRNNYGQLVVSSDSPNEKELLTRPATVLVEAISDEQHNIGFVQVVINDKQLLDSPHRTHAYLSFFGQFLLAFAVLAGIFIAITFNKWRYRLVAQRLPNNR